MLDYLYENIVKLKDKLYFVAKKIIDIKNKFQHKTTFDKRVLSGAQIDGITKKNIIRKNLNDSLVIKKSELKIKDREEVEIKRSAKEQENVDGNKRLFLKVAGVAGLGLAASAILPKSADAYIAGGAPTSNVVGLKNSSNTRINPATEDTLNTLLKPTDLDFDSSGYLNVNVQSTSASAAGSSFSDSLDVSQFALVDADRHVQVDVLSSVLPDTASTETTLQTLSFGGFKFALRMATLGNFDYIGEATMGSLTSSAVWRIKRIDNTSGVVITWAGSGAFDQVWDNYPSLTYL